MDGVRVIYGIDFSGAQDAGNKIWIAKGVPKGKALLIEECRSASDLPNSGKRREECLPALLQYIKSKQNGHFGFDFPFGLPRNLVHEETWEEFVLGFHEKYESPEVFREACRQVNEGHELKRQTDTEARTPFSPYNLRLFKQTYYGISRVLFPLVRDESACVLPFQKPVAGKPWILEVCPASTLKHLMKKRVPPYKGPEEDKRENRRQILANVMKAGVVFGKNAELKGKIIADNGGDALDSIIAGMAVFRTLGKRLDPCPMVPDYLLEGHVYWRV
jgi:hypothetical protein